MRFKRVLEQLQQGVLTPYNFYNIDIGYDQHVATEHYLKKKHDTIDTVQILNKVFLDIEVYIEEEGISIAEMISRGNFLVNAVSHYHSNEKKYYCYVIPPANSNLTPEKCREYFLTESKKPLIIGKDDDGNDILDTYLMDDEDIEVLFFNSGFELVKALWAKIRETDPAVLSSFNGDNFDFPYLYKYLLYNCHNQHEQVAKIMSRFESVELRPGRDRAGNETLWVNIADFPVVDMLYSYRAREDGGLGLGKKLQSYSLKNISTIELGLTKLEYASEGLTLNQLYEQKPLDFFLYNLWDTALIVKLDRKMELISLYNLQRRKMRTSLSSALRGSSILFDTYVFSELYKEKKYVRWGINSETSFNITKYDIDRIIQPKSKSKINWNVEEIYSKKISQILTRFPGAYVF